MSMQYPDLVGSSHMNFIYFIYIYFLLDIFLLQLLLLKKWLDQLCMSWCESVITSW